MRRQDALATRGRDARDTRAAMIVDSCTHIWTAPEQLGLGAEAYLGRWGGPVEIHAHFEESPPTAGVLKTLEREQPDLLVVGSQQRSFLAALLVGSVALRIVRHAKLPVLVVKSKKDKLGLLAALERL